MSLTKSQKDNLNTLINTLEMGEYNQTRGILRRGDCYCIGGVMCDISGMGEWGRVLHETALKNEFIGEDGFCFHPNVEAEDFNFFPDRQYIGAVPSVVQVYYGMTDEAMSVLMDANDNDAPFRTMATALEQYIECDGEGEEWMNALRPYLPQPWEEARI